MKKYVSFSETSWRRLNRVVDEVGCLHLPKVIDNTPKLFDDCFNGPSGNWYANGDKDNPIKLGKILNACGGFGPKEVLKIVERWKENYSVNEDIVGVLEVSTDLAKTYDMEHGESGTISESCMINCGQYYYSLECANVKVVRLVENGVLKGRALLWEKMELHGDYITFMDRIYYNNHNTLNAFKKYARDNGYYYKTHQNFDSPKDITTPLGEEIQGDLFYKYHHGGDSLPYMDTMTWLDNNGFNNYDCGMALTDTSGNDDLTLCDECGELYNHESEGAYIDSTGECVCDVCLDDKYAYVNNEWHPLDECCEIDREWHLKEDCAYDELREEYITMDESTITYGGTTTHIDNVTYCENVEDYVLIDSEELEFCSTCDEPYHTDMPKVCGCEMEEVA